MKKIFKICVIGGDGIGPEVVGETVKLLKKTGLNFIRYPNAKNGRSGNVKRSPKKI